MSSQTVNELVSQIVHAGLDSARLQELLAASFKKSAGNPYWTSHKFELKDGPFAGGEFRQSKAGDKALLSLRVRESLPVAVGELDLSPWGPLRNITLSPGIPPEGADAYVYSVAGVQVSFQFTHSSRRLLNVALEWGLAA